MRKGKREEESHILLSTLTSHYLNKIDSIPSVIIPYCPSPTPPRKRGGEFFPMKFLGTGETSKELMSPLSEGG